MHQLYKYLNERYLSAMIDDGSIRIGTFDYYRKHHSPEVQDSGEGTRTVTSGPGEYINKGTDDLIALLNRLPGVNISSGAIKASSGSVRISNFGIAGHSTTPNALLYCVTKKPSLTKLESFGGTQDCIEIVDPDNFFRVLTIALSHRLHQLGHELVQHSNGFRDCEYGPRIQNWENSPPYNAFFRKEDKLIYMEQFESRIVWIANNDKNLPPTIDMNVAEIRPFIRRCTLTD